MLAVNSWFWITESVLVTRFSTHVAWNFLHKIIKASEDASHVFDRYLSKSCQPCTGSLAMAYFRFRKMSVGLKLRVNDKYLTIKSLNIKVFSSRTRYHNVKKEHSGKNAFDPKFHLGVSLLRCIQCSSGYWHDRWPCIATWCCKSLLIPLCWHFDKLSFNGQPAIAHGML